MKNHSAIAFILLALFGCSTVAFADKCPLAGETAHISTFDDLNHMFVCIATTDTEGTTFLLDQDLDLSGHPYQFQSRLYSTFKGTFDGQNHQISNFTDGSPFFYTIGGNHPVVKNLILTHAAIGSIALLSDAATVVDMLNSGTIENVHVINSTVTQGNDTPSNTAGFAAQLLGGTIDHCSFNGEVKILKDQGVDLGGLVGGQFAGTITNSSFDGKISLIGNGNSNIGGLVGSVVMGGLVTHSFSTGEIDLIGKNNRSIGGLIGSLFTSVDSSYSSMKITAESNSSSKYIGGLISDSNYGIITNCYANGSIISDNSTTEFVAGLVSSIHAGQLINTYSATTMNPGNYGLVAMGDADCENSYWDINTNKSEISSVCVDGKRTTDEMKNPDLSKTYQGWDFAKIWSKTPNSYPTLTATPLHLN